MRKNILKVVSMVVFLLVMIVGCMYLIDLNKIKNGEEVIFSTWGKRYSPVIKVNKNESVEKKYQKYLKTVDNVNIELDVPDDWRYVEIPKNKEDDFYKYALKIYKNNENQYAMLYFYNDQFAVCGTGRTDKKIILNNKKNATVGYYDGKKEWEDISFYSINKNIAFINKGLKDSESDELLEIIKTINIK